MADDFLILTHLIQDNRNKKYLYSNGVWDLKVLSIQTLWKLWNLGW